MALEIYLLKSVAILSIFYGVYYIFLRKDTHFAAKRHYFLSGIVASIVLPFVEFTRVIYREAPVIETGTFVETLREIPEIVAANETSSGIEFMQVVGFIYLAGLLCLLIQSLVQLFNLLKLIRSNPSEKRKKYTFVQVKDTLSPFSFFRYIIYNPGSHSEEELQMILKHEQVHVSQWHSIDMIAAQIARIIQWVNPFSWLYKKSLEENLEFIADNETVSQVSSKKEYQLVLVKASSAVKAPALTTQFYQSFIKKRIIMLNKNTSNRRNLWKLSFVLPALALFLWSFNVKEEVVYKEAEKMENPRSHSFVITSETNSAQLDAIEVQLNKQAKNSTLRFEDREWNDQNELTKFSLKTKFNTQFRFHTNAIIGGESGEAITALNVKFTEGAFQFTDMENQSVIKVTSNGVVANIPKLALSSNGKSDPLKKENSAILSKGKNADELPRAKTKEELKPAGGTAEEVPLAADGMNTSDPINNTLEASDKEFRFTITKNTTDAELEEMQAVLKKEHDIDMKYNVDRNSNNEITSINISYTNNKGRNGNYTVQNDEPIEEFVFYLNDEGESGFWSEAKERRRAERMEKRMMEMKERKETRDRRMIEREEEMKVLKEQMAKRRVEMKERELEMKARSKELAKRSYARAKEIEEENERNISRELAIVAEDEARVRRLKNKRGASVYSSGRNLDAVIVIDKDTTDDDLKEIQSNLSGEGKTFNYSKVKRNSAGEIVRIKITVNDGKGSKSTISASADDGEPINEIIIEN